MNQTPSVEIISEEPTALNSTSGVTYLCKCCSVSIPDVFFDNHQQICASNPDTIGNSTSSANRQEQGSSKAGNSTTASVVDLSRLTSSHQPNIDLTCNSPILIDSSGSIDAEGSPSVQPQGDSDTTDTVHAYDIKCESDYTPPPSPELDMCVLDSELSLRERNWEITYREN